MWSLLAIAGGLGLLVALLGSPANAHAPGTVTNFYIYSSSTCPTDKATEPVNIVFTGYANSSRSQNHLQKHTTWKSTSGNTRYLKGHDECSSQNWQRAGGTSTSHWHARGRTLHKNLSSTDGTTFASAHLEVLKACGHAVKSTGFDSGREKVYNSFGGPLGLQDHPSATVNFGNSRNFRQCDNVYAGSNGKVYSIRIPNASHP